MRILLIDDDVFIQKFYSSKLREKGFEVSVASDGEEGLAQAMKGKPDIILLDMILPKFDGFALLQSLSQQRNLKTIPVLVLSSLGQESDIEKAKKLGARDYVNKGFYDFDALIGKIAALVKSK